MTKEAGQVDQSPPGSSEQAADLAALQAAAGSGAAAVEAKPETEGPSAPGASALAAAGVLVGMARPLLCFAVPVLKSAPDELWEPLPEGVAVILDHYGVGESELMANPWARLAFSAAPLAVYAVMHSEPKKKESDQLAAPVSVPGQEQQAAPNSGKQVIAGTVIPA